tara:strand:+ start:1264 stop:1929 length:666 start_codon:yes stop_codon:yes gene_type:complete
MKLFSVCRNHTLEFILDFSVPLADNLLSITPVDHSNCKYHGPRCERTEERVLLQNIWEEYPSYRDKLFSFPIVDEKDLHTFHERFEHGIFESFGDEDIKTICKGFNSASVPSSFQRLILKYEKYGGSEEEEIIWENLQETVQQVICSMNDSFSVATEKVQNLLALQTICPTEANAVARHLLPDSPLHLLRLRRLHLDVQKVRQRQGLKGSVNRWVYLRHGL